jgi:hypothetical protein
MDDYDKIYNFILLNKEIIESTKTKKEIVDYYINNEINNEINN